MKRGVKKTLQELVSDDTLTKYEEGLQVPDWKLVLLQAMARVSGKAWQSVINITGLGRTRETKIVTALVQSSFFFLPRPLTTTKVEQIPTQTNCLKFSLVVFM